MKRNALVLALAIAGAASPVAAQDAGWSFGGTIYAWLPAMSNKIDTDSAAGTVKTDLSFSDAIGDLEFAFMGEFEARRDRWGLIGDLIYSDISISNPTRRGVLFEKSTLDTKLAMFSGYALYRYYDTSEVAIDAGVGFRAYSADVDLRLSGNRLDDRSFGGSETWVDPLVAARVIVPITEKWYATAFADLGGTGSNEMTYQALASVGYRFSERWTARAAYRYLNIQKPFGGNDVTTELYGPVLGATYEF